MRYCANCSLPEDLMDTCGRKAFGDAFQCPEPTEIADDKAVRVSCAPCGRDFVFPASKAMKGSNAITTCQLGECAAKFTFPAPPPKPTGKKAQVPPPLTPDPVSEPTPSPDAEGGAA